MNVRIDFFPPSLKARGNLQLSVSSGGIRLMHWNDFLHPERAAKAVFKLFAVGLVLIIVGSELIRRIACVRLSPGIAGLGMLFSLTLLSIIAYVIRENRRNERTRPPSTRGAERTPLLPRLEEGEE